MAESLAAGKEAQRPVLGGLPIDGETRGDAAREIIECLEGSLAKTRVLMKAIRGVFCARRLPVDLMTDLLDVAPQKRLEHRIVMLASSHFLHQRADPGRPMRLQHHSALRLGVVEHLEQQVSIAVCRMMLQA